MTTLSIVSPLTLVSPISTPKIGEFLPIQWTETTPTRTVIRTGITVLIRVVSELTRPSSRTPSRRLTTKSQLIGLTRTRNRLIIVVWRTRCLLVSFSARLTILFSIDALASFRLVVIGITTGSQMTWTRTPLIIFWRKLARLPLPIAVLGISSSAENTPNTRSPTR